MSNICQITHKKANHGYTISHSHRRTKKIQHVNLHKRKIWNIKTKMYVVHTLSTKAMKTLLKSK